jgi:uncharacterized protein
MSAKLNIRQLKTGKSRHEFVLEGPDLEFDTTDLLEVVGAKLWMDVDNHVEEIYVKGETDVTLKLECARCLEPFDLSRVYPLALVIKLARKGEIGGPDGQSSDDYFVLDDGADEFDLVPIIKERVILSLPMKPLCSENCKGLCAKCGTNLNNGSCDCSIGVVDERFSALEELKKSYGGE